MNNFLFSLNSFRKKTIFHLAILLLLFTLPCMASCKKKINYFDYVSELRSNVFLARSETLSLRVYAITKESPYSAGGVPRETFSRMEAYLVAPEGNKTTSLTFQIEEQSYSGEMSYDMVKGEYYYACSVDLSKLTSLLCLIKYGEDEVQLTATSILTENTLTPHDALTKIYDENVELFTSLTDKHGFAGEICLRLIYEGAPYYYVGIIDRKGNCNAFLMNAETGKILAKRLT
jgi:hypothetical protein